MWLERDESRPLSTSVDVYFRLACPELPVDHAQTLFEALETHLPWAAETAAIQSITPVSGNGWTQPEAVSGAMLKLSRRTRLRMRVPRDKAPVLIGLTGIELMVGGHPLRLGEASIRELVAEPTLYARRIVVADIDDEGALLEAATAHLAKLGIAASKLLCGRAGVMTYGAHKLSTRGLMVAELLPQESLRLQDAGFGNHQHLGCGVFVPHKNIAPV